MDRERFSPCKQDADTLHLSMGSCRIFSLTALAYRTNALAKQKLLITSVLIVEACLCRMSLHSTTWARSWERVSLAQHAWQKKRLQATSMPASQLPSASLCEFSAQLSRSRVVLPCVHRQGTKQQCSLHVCLGCSTPEDIDDVRREVQIMHHLAGHPHITKLKGAYEDRTSVHLVQSPAGMCVHAADAHPPVSETPCSRCCICSASNHVQWLVHAAGSNCVSQ